jgi:nucleotide-binding universal stress UspA family protein
VFRKILVPLDGSPLGEHALPYALGIAKKAGAQVHIALVHVPEAYSEFEAPGAEDFEIDAKAREEAYLEALGRRLTGMPKGSVHLHHLEGIPQETLAEEVVEREIDLVVMNVHGWGYLSRAMTGSVSDYLMRHLTVPMLVMHAHNSSTDLTRDPAIKSILICLDGSELAETIIPQAAALGSLWNVRFNLVRVASLPGPLAAGGGEETQAMRRHLLDKASKEAIAYLRGVAERLGQGGSNTQIHAPVHSNTTAAILETATATACDVIAVATHGRGGLSRLLLGSVADKVMRGAHCPVLVYRPPH